MKKGFTLIELLAVIVILAIIALIATPIVLNIINDVKKSAIERSAEFYLEGVETAIATSVLKNIQIPDGTYSIMQDGNICIRTLVNNTCTGEILEIEVDGEKPKGGAIKIKDSQIESSLIKHGDSITKSDNYVMSIDEMQELYEFKYYGTLKDAIGDVNNGNIGANEDADKSTASVGIYIDEEGTRTVVFLKDAEISERIKLNSDVAINLGGNTLNATDAYAFVGTSESDINVTIDGRLNGSQIINKSSNTDNYIIYAQANNEISIIGGTYTTEATGYAITVRQAANSTVKVSDATLLAKSEKNSYGVYAYENTTTEIKNCNISSESNYMAGGIYSNGIVNIDNSQFKSVAHGDSQAVGIVIRANGTATISNSTIKAYSDFITDRNMGTYGILNYNKLILNNCNVFGVFAGVSNLGGTVEINGGLYEGYGAGGVFFSKDGTTASYIRNAELKHSGMPDGYSYIKDPDITGLWIAGNKTVYVDNCNISGSEWPIVLKGNSELYISNSNINLDYSEIGIYNENETAKVYIGKNCNFTSANVQTQSAVFTKNEVYTKK